MKSTTCPNCDNQAVSHIFKAIGFAVSIHCKVCGSMLKLDEKKLKSTSFAFAIFLLILWWLFDVSIWYCLAILIIVGVIWQYKQPLIIVQTFNNHLKTK